MKRFSTLFLIIGIVMAHADEPIRQFDLQTMERLGNLMFEQDIRAARATDLVLASGIDAEAAGVLGWIVVEEGNQTMIRFFREEDGRFFSMVDVEFTGRRDGRLVLRDSDPLSSEQSALAHARMTVIEDLEKVSGLCSPHYNLITLQDPEYSGILVWAIAANLNPKEVQVGGHLRYSLTDDGREIRARDRLYKSCLVLSLQPDDMPEGASLEALTMGWVVSDTPLEIHVFLQRYVRLPFFIMTTSNFRIWKLEQGKIMAQN